MIGDSGLGYGGFDVRCKRLVRLLAVRSVVDDHCYTLSRQPGDFVRRDLTAYHHCVAELADHIVLTLLLRPDLR